MERSYFYLINSTIIELYNDFYIKLNKNKHLKVNIMIYKDEIENLKKADNYREIYNIQKKIEKYIFIDNKKLLNLSSNDYLGLGTNKELLKEFINEKINNDEFLFSSSSSRLLTGTSNIYKELEENLAKLYKKEKALLFNTGYQCNLGVISSIAKANDIIFSDKLNHASIIDGIKLSNSQFYRYKHLDYNHLEQLLKNHRYKYKNAFIISESIFSMDGDIADINSLIELKNKYNCKLIIDEAHAFGVFGENLCGYFEKNKEDIDIITATFGKALASQGAFVIANKNLINFLINKSRSFIFSTALPSASIMWVNWLLSKKNKNLKIQQKKLHNLLTKTNSYINKINISNSKTQIIPIVIGDNKKTIDMYQKLYNNNILALPIRTPSVPPNKARLRISINSNIASLALKKTSDIINKELKDKIYEI